MGQDKERNDIALTLDKRRFWESIRDKMGEGVKRKEIFRPKVLLKSLDICSIAQ